MVTGGTQEHSGAGFAVFVIAAVFAKPVLGMIRTAIDLTERRSLGGELLLHPVCQDVELGLRIEAASDTCLIRNDYQLVTEADGQTAEIEDALYPDNIFFFMEVPDLFIDNAVTVEEECRGQCFDVRFQSDPPPGF